jgi:hypothetical protein
VADEGDAAAMLLADRTAFAALGGTAAEAMARPISIAWGAAAAADSGDGSRASTGTEAVLLVDGATGPGDFGVEEVTAAVRLAGVCGSSTAATLKGGAAW